MVETIMTVVAVGAVFVVVLMIKEHGDERDEL